jgi:hypothetical protein
MSHLFERPLCEMGVAFDYAFRPVVGAADEGAGGPCDDRPHRVELFAAQADPKSAFCPEHETQLARYDHRLQSTGLASRFRRRESSSRP